MKDMNWKDVPAWVALGISLGAALLSWRALKWEKQSAQAADRSANDAARANQIAERALKISARNPTTPSDSRASSEVTWRMEKRSGDSYVLRNNGTDAAEHVYVDETRAPRINRRLPSDSVVQPGAGHEMLLKGSWQQPMPTELYARWAGHDGWVAVPLPS